MSITSLKHSIKKFRLTREIYFGLRYWTIIFRDALKVRKLARQFRNYDTLIVRDRDAGFFSLYFQMLCIIRIATINKQKIWVQFDTGPYFDPTREESSWWEYYFEHSDRNPSKEQLDLTSNSKAHRIDSRELLQQFSRIGSRFPRKTAYKINSEICIKEKLLKMIENFREQNFGSDFILGIHFRGTDKVSGQIQESKRVSYDSIDLILDSIAELNLPFRVFAATDETQFIDYLESKEEIQAVYTDGIRSDNDSPVHLSEGLGSNYQLGVDALLDSILLSKCDFLIRTESNLSRASEFFNPSLVSINLSREHAHARNDLTQEAPIDVTYIRKQFQSAFRKKQKTCKTHPDVN